jgi:hypothetical protein
MSGTIPILPRHSLCPIEISHGVDFNPAHQMITKGTKGRGSLPSGADYLMTSPLLFCTSYIEDAKTWGTRYHEWLAYHEKLFPSAVIALFDDASPYLPSEAGIRINVINQSPQAFQLGERATIFTFPSHLGRHSITNFPGWFRSFTYSTEVARALGATKIIHIESDAYLLSQRAVDLVNHLDEGWTAFWCPRWNFPETAIQIICQDQFGALDLIGRTPYGSKLANQLLERTLPFTNIAMELRGDRYGEYRFIRKIPRNADFAAQVKSKVHFRTA